MPADGKVKYSAREARCHGMGIDDYLYRYTAYDAAHDAVRILGERERLQREEDIAQSNLRNHAGFVANGSIRHMGRFTHPKYGQGRLVGIGDGLWHVEFPGHGIVGIPMTA